MNEDMGHSINTLTYSEGCEAIPFCGANSFMDVKQREELYLLG
jgi:hypothetical protein